MFYGFVLTKVGEQLLAQTVAGEQVQITRVLMEKGTAESAEAARALTDLISPGPAATSTLPTVNGNSVQFLVEYRSDLNGGLAEGFWIGGFAIFAKTAQSEEVMLYYASLGDQKQYVGAYAAGVAPDVRRYPVSLQLQAGIESSPAYPAEAWMTAEDVAAYFNGSIKVELFEAVAETIKVHDRDPTAHALQLAAYIRRAEMGAQSGVATLDEAGKVPAGQLPSYVDDVVEFPTVSAFPQPGEAGKIYVALDVNNTYRWSGSTYVEISKSLALGETASTAFQGNLGKIAYEHSQSRGNPHETTAAQISYTDNLELDATTVQEGIDQVARLANDAKEAAEEAKLGGCVVDVVFGDLYVGYAFVVSAAGIEVKRGLVPEEMIVTVTGLPVSKPIVASIENVGGASVVKSINTPAYFTRQSINFSSTYVFDLTVAFADGTPVPNKEVGGLLATQGSAKVTTDSQGRCMGMAATANPTITMSFADYIGVADLTTTLDASGTLTTKTIHPGRTIDNILYIGKSNTYKLSPEILDFDIAAIGAGGGGAHGTVDDSNNATGGHGGGGGSINNICNKTRIPELTASVGAGGIGGDSTKDASDGGDTRVIQLGLVAKGGKRATTSSPGLSTNGGWGGNGARYVQAGNLSSAYPATRGEDRVVFPLNDLALAASGGGGGGGETHSHSDSSGNGVRPEPGAYGGATCGGAGGTGYGSRGTDGQAPGGGGGGGIQYQSAGGRGGNGGVFVRWRYLT